MSTQFTSNNPTSYFGIQPTTPGQNWYRRRDPNSTDYKGYAIGDRWINLASSSIWALVGNSAHVATWVPLGGGSTAIATLTPDAGVAVTPTAGNIDIGGDAAQGVSTSNGGLSTLVVSVQDATTALKGVVNLATNAEAIAGTDTAKAITSDDLKAKLGTQVAHSLLVAEGTASALTSLPTGTAGQVLLSGGAVSDPAYSAFITSTAAGVVAMPSQSGVSAYLGASLLNATGDGTTLTIPFDTLDYDFQNEFNTGTGIFTAKNAGIYLINCNVLMQNIDVAHTLGNTAIIKNSDIWWQVQFNPGVSKESGNQFSTTGNVIVQLAASDTIKVVIAVGNGAKTVTIGSAAGAHTTLQISKVA
jgi:hypothetical protein